MLSFDSTLMAVPVDLGTDVIHAGDEMTKGVSKTRSKCLRLLHGRLGEEPEKKGGLLNRCESCSPIR